MAADRLDEQRLHVAVGRTAVRVPPLQRGAERAHAAQPTTRVPIEMRLRRRVGDETFAARALDHRFEEVDAWISPRQVENHALGTRDRDAVEQPDLTRFESATFVNDQAGPNR